LIGVKKVASTSALKKEQRNEREEREENERMSEAQQQNRVKRRENERKGETTQRYKPQIFFFFQHTNDRKERNKTTNEKEHMTNTTQMREE